MTKPMFERSQGAENAFLGWNDNQLQRRPSQSSSVIRQIQIDYFACVTTTYTTPAGATHLVMEAVGAGGGGGAVAAGSPANKGAGGGGAGGYARVWIDSPEASYDIIGACGGNAGISASSDVDGGTATDTTVTDPFAVVVLEAGGGVGGIGVVDANSVPWGGVGASGVGDTGVLQGGTGANGTVGTGGNGGDSFLGPGGRAGITSTFPYLHQDGLNAADGGGGGGACQDPIPLTGYDGGAGGNSLLIIYAYGP